MREPAHRHGGECTERWRRSINSFHIESCCALQLAISEELLVCRETLYRRRLDEIEAITHTTSGK